MPQYDYICANGHKTERRVADTSLQAILCPKCRKTAHRVPFYRSQYIVGETVRKVPVASR